MPNCKHFNGYNSYLVNQKQLDKSWGLCEQLEVSESKRPTKFQRNTCSTVDLLSIFSFKLLLVDTFSSSSWWRGSVIKALLSIISYCWSNFNLDLLKYVARPSCCLSLILKTPSNPNASNAGDKLSTKNPLSTSWRQTMSALYPDSSFLIRFCL